MKRSLWHCSEKPFNGAETETGYRSTWTGTGLIPEHSGEYFMRKPRKQYLCHLISEFEKCAQQSEDMLEVKKEVETLKRSMEELSTLIEDIKFENKMTADKVKLLTNNFKEMKTSHYQLRDEVSREFRKSYKRIGTIDKEVDLVKYRQSMANKKHSLEMESLRWELNVSKSEGPVCSSPTVSLDTHSRFNTDANFENSCV